MNIQKKSETASTPYLNNTFIFLPLFSFRKEPGADWSSAPGFFRFLFTQRRATGTPGTAFPTVRIPYAERILATGREVLLALRLAQPTSPAFAPGQARYAERILATSREGPMVLFNHRPARTNWPRALPGVPYGSTYIRRAEASDRSGGFCSPCGSHTPSVTSLAPRYAWGS